MTDRTTYPLSTEKVLHGLAGLRDQKLLCDVNLVAEDETFPVHKVVLAAASPYFQAMFTGGFRENGMTVVTMEQISSKGLGYVLGAIYNSQITLTERTVEDILAAASLLQLSDIIEACEKFLISQITETNCISFLNMCEKYETQKALSVINEFIIDNFETVVKTDDFSKISREALCKYMSSDALKVPNGEIEVFKAAVGWLENNLTKEATEAQYAEPDEESMQATESIDITDVIKHVRFPLIPADILLDEALQVPFIYENKPCRNLVTEALRFHSHPFTQPLQDGQQYQPRGEQKLVIIPCGTRHNGYVVQETETQLHVLDITQGEDSVVEDDARDLPISFAFRSMAVVNKGNYLFLFATDNKSFNSVAIRFDVNANKCVDLKAPPCQATIGSTVARSQDEIYLAGGMVVTKDSGALDPRFFTAKTLQYTIGSNSWIEVCTMPQAMTYHASASHGDFIYVAGGYIGLGHAETTSRMYAYDIRGNTWLTKAEMHHSRYQFCLETVNDSIYACGGRSRDYSTGETSIEIYSVMNDQWTILDNAILEHCVSSDTFVLNNKLYIVGGREKDENGQWCDSDLISCVDVTDNSLLRVMNLPFRSARHVCDMLTVPRS